MMKKFCESQRPIFKDYIKARKLSCPQMKADRHIHEVIGEGRQNGSGSNSSSDNDGGEATLLGYLNSLLEYFHTNLKLDFDADGCNQEGKLTKEYRIKIQELLFKLNEEELTKSAGKA